MSKRDDCRDRIRRDINRTLLRQGCRQTDISPDHLILAIAEAVANEITPKPTDDEAGKPEAE